MAWSINEIQMIGNSILGLVVEHDALGLDGDAPFTLYIEGIEDLLLHLPIRQASTLLDKPIGNSGLAMVNMGNDGKISDVL